MDEQKKCAGCDTMLDGTNHCACTPEVCKSCCKCEPGCADCTCKPAA